MKIFQSKKNNLILFWFAATVLISCNPPSTSVQPTVTVTGSPGASSIVFPSTGGTGISPSPIISPVVTNSPSETKRLYTVAGKVIPSSGPILATDASLYDREDSDEISSIQLDSNGNLYVSNMYIVKKVEKSSGLISNFTCNQRRVNSGCWDVYNTLPTDTPVSQFSARQNRDIARDANGNLYFAIQNNIIKVDSSGKLIHIAGKTQFGGEEKVNITSFITLEAITVDSQNNIYFVDSGANIIKKIDINGKVSTIAGNGGNGFTVDGGKATEASLSQPSDITVDSSGNIFIVDKGNKRIRKIDTNGVITTVIGGGDNQSDNIKGTDFSLIIPGKIAVDKNGNLLFTDEANQKVRMLNIADGMISTVAGNGSKGFVGDMGPAKDAYLNTPRDISIDLNNNLYIFDAGNVTVRKVDQDGIITTYAGNGGTQGDNGPAKSALLKSPSTIFFDSSDNLFIADRGNSRVRKVNMQGIISTVAGMGNFQFGEIIPNVFPTPAYQPNVTENVPATNSNIAAPQFITIGKSGNLYLADFYGRIRKVNSQGIINTVAGPGTAPQGLEDNIPAISAYTYGTTGLAVDSQENIYFTAPNNLVRKIDNNGIVTTYAGSLDRSGFGPTPPSSPRPADLPGAGADDGEKAAQGFLKGPGWLVTDKDDNLYFSEWEKHKIRKVDKNGIISTIAGNGKGRKYSSTYTTLPDVSDPLSIAIEPSILAIDKAGNLYFVDGGFIVRKIDAKGSMSIVAGMGPGGQGQSTNTDEGIESTKASFMVGGMAIDSKGTLYISDNQNNLIRKLE